MSNEEMADVLAAHDAIERPKRSIKQFLEDTERLLAAEGRLAKKMGCPKRAAHKLGYEAWMKTQPEEDQWGYEEQPMWHEADES